MHQLEWSRLAGLCLLACTLSLARAAELGEPVVRTYQSQPLVADVELTSLADPAAPVQVRVAHPDVYKIANIRMHPLLSNLNMTVMRRDGRQFLHITTTKPVEGDYLHLFLDVIQGGRRDVRALTLWLTPDPAPPAPPPPPPQPAPVAAPLPRPIEKITRAAAPPAACAPQISAEQLRTCSQLDYKNSLLSAQIVELEEKVKLLQLAIENNKPEPAKAAPPAATPRIAASLPPPAKKKEKAGTNWLLIGGAAGAAVLLLALGGFLFMRHKKKGAAPAEPKPGFFARFKRKPKEVPPPAEPQL